MLPDVVDEDFSLSEAGSNAECQELVSSEHSEESSTQSVAKGKVGHRLLSR